MFSVGINETVQTYCGLSRPILHYYCPKAADRHMHRFSFSYPPAAVLLQPRITFPLSITGTRPPLSSRESPQGQLIMDLNAAHYPDKAGAVAGQWLPDWLDDSHTALTGRQR